MKPSLSLALSSSILCSMTRTGFPSSFTFPSSLSPPLSLSSPPPSPFSPPHHFLPPQTLSSASSHIPSLSPFPGTWASFVSHARPRLSSGQRGLPRLRRVTWSMPGGGGGSNPIWKGHCAPLQVLSASCCLPSPPTLLSTQTGHEAGWAVPPHWQCPPHCSQLEP